MFVQAIPPTQISGGGGIHPPIPPGIYASVKLLEYSCNVRCHLQKKFHGVIILCFYVL